MIADLFAKDIHRRIEEVIKVDQIDEQIVLDEIAEYVFTASIRNAYRTILDRFAETPNKPHEGIGVWVSGFFGSGKSSFAKNLGFAIANRTLQGESAADAFGLQADDTTIKVLLRQIVEYIPTHAVIFDIATDRGIRTGSQTVTEIMYRLFLRSLGYAEDIDLAELEITLEEQGQLPGFEQAYLDLYGQSWPEQKGLVAIALSRASRVMHTLDATTYPAADSWVQAAKNRANITPGLLADRCKELMQRRRPGQALLFVVDEVGQFVARDVQKMLDLQAVVQALGRVGPRQDVAGRHLPGETQRGGRRHGRPTHRVAPPPGSFPLRIAGAPGAVRHRRGDRQAGFRQERSGAEQLRGLYKAHRGRLGSPYAAHRRHQAAGPQRPSFIDLYPLLALSNRPHHPDRLRPAHARQRQQTCGRRHPHHHQTGPAIDHQPGSQPGRAARGTARYAGSGV